MDSLTPEQQVFARSEDGGMSLKEIVQNHKPTMLLGVTAVGGLFTEDIIREMNTHVERPIIFPLSNPTTRAECTAEQAYEWTDGNCIFASGSPFDPVHLEDGRTLYPSQCNNSKSRRRMVNARCLVHFSHFLLSRCSVCVPRSRTWRHCLRC